MSDMAMGGFDVRNLMGQGGSVNDPLPMQMLPEDENLKRQDSVADHLLYGTTGAVAAFFNTVGNSVGMLDGDAVEHYFEKTQFGNYYTRNKEALQTIGDLGGMFLPGMGAMNLVRGGSWLSRAAKFGVRGVETTPEAFLRYNAAKESGSKVLGTSFAHDNVLNKIFTSGQESGQRLAMMEAKFGNIARKTGQTDWGNGINLKEWNKDTKDLLKTNLWDSVKENVAFEFGVFATMNSSQTLYPDDWSFAELAALNAPLPMLGALASRIYTKGQIQKMVHRTLSPEGYFARFPDAKAIGEFSGVSSPNGRFMPMIYAWDTRTHAQNLAKNQLDNYEQQTLLNTNMNAQSVAAEQIVKVEAERLGQDSTLPGITNKFDFDARNFNVLKTALSKNVNSVAGVISFEDMPSHGAGYVGEVLGARKDATVKKNYKAYLQSLDDLGKAEQQGADTTAYAHKLEKDLKDYENARDSVMLTADADGTLVLANERPLLAQDFMTMDNIGRENGDVLSPGYMTLRSTESVTAGSKMQQFYKLDLGSGHISVPGGIQKQIETIYETGAVFFAGKNVTTLLDPGSAAMAEARKNELMLLKDFAKDWGLNGHHFNREIAPKLSRTTKTALDNWTGSSNTEIREWIKQADAGDTRAQGLLDEIYKANEPARQRLHEIAKLRGGTIMLYRGLGKTEAEGTSIPKVASYTSNLHIADKKFGTHTISKEIDPNDVLAVVKGLNEDEYIIRNNHLRAPANSPKGTANATTQQRVITQTIANADVDFTTMNTAEMSKVFMLAEQGVKEIESKITKQSLKAPIFLDPSANILQADMAIELRNRLSPDAFAAHIKLPDNMTADQIEMHALNHSYKQFRLWQNVEAHLMGAAHEAGDDMLTTVTKNAAQQLAAKGKKLDVKTGMDAGITSMSATEFRYLANLPQPDLGKSDNLLALFGMVHMQGDESLFSAFKSIQDFKIALTDPGRFGQYGNVDPNFLKIADAQNTRGSMLRWDPEKNRSFNLVMAGKSDAMMINSRQALQDAANLQRATTFTRFGEAEKYGSMFSPITLRTFHGTNEGTIMSNAISSLGNGSQRGDGFFTTRNFSAGESPFLKAADSAEDKSSREYNNAITKLMASTGMQMNPPLLKANKAAQEEFNRFLHIRQQGFPVLKEPVMEKGKMRWVLDTNDSLSKSLWKKYFDEDMPVLPEGQVLYMPDTTVPVKPGDKMLYKPFEIGEKESLSMVGTAQQLGDAVYRENLALHRIRGENDPTYKAWWVPPVNFASPFTALIREGDALGRPIVLLQADNAATLQQKIAAHTEALGKQKRNFIVQDEKVLRNSYDLRDEAFSKLVNFTDPLAQTGKAKGTQAGFVHVTGDKPLQDFQQSIEGLLQSFARRNRALYLEPTINQIRLLDSAMAYAPGAARSGNATPTRKALNLIFGNPTLDSNSNQGKFYNGLEGLADDFLEAVQNRISTKLGGRSDDSENSVEAHWRKHGAPNIAPFGDGLEAAARSVQVPEPWKAKNIVNGLNSLTANLALRILDFGFVGLNYASLLATTPAVIKALQRQGNETVEQWSARLGSHATIQGDQAFLSPARVMATAMHDYFNEMVDYNGKKMLLVDVIKERGLGRSTIMEIMDSLVKPHQGPIMSKIQKAVDWAAKPADWSEEFARTYSIVLGAGLAKKAGIENLEDRLAFGMRLANDNIGDYRPNNKPKMFQGTVGSSMGLFTTFMWNYYQRLYKYVESGDKKALMVQMGLQASLFGVKTVPGFSQYVNLFASNYDGTSNPVEGFRERFGEAATDWFFYGSLSNLPKMFGASDGLALYSRGDAGMRMIPTVFTPTQIPAVQTLTKIYGAAGEAFAAMKNNGVSPRQLAEIAAQYSVSRPFRGAVELVNGHSLDNQDRLVNTQVHEPLGIIARLTGLRTLQESKNFEAWFELGDAQAARAGRQKELRDTVRYNLRQGGYGGADGTKKLAGDLRDYIVRGGDPTGIPTWLRNQVLASTLDRNSNKLIELMKGNKNAHDIADIKKLIHYMMPLADSDFKP